MKLNSLAAPAALKPYLKAELMQYNTAMHTGKLPQAWHHLERAHVLSQPFALQHTHIHWKMLRFGIKTKNTKEVLGQIPRLLVGGVKSFVGKVPGGNTGGANVPPLKAMPIPEDLKAIFTQCDIKL